ncbi:MAG: putative ABC transporter permease [Eubacteriales bacterium]|nr:putative ABC transporter permease [Eubacteriales bacterium]MDD4390139.1 putative ABC transporter permease [Eubacteriales bacterium]
MKNKLKMEQLNKYIIYFMMYAILGWLYEVFLEVVVYQWGFSNRGVLYGPYTPIYGVGATSFLLCFGGIMKKKTPSWFKFIKPIIIFAGCMILATTIELAASYILEFVIGSWPWQTYEDYAINFQGRIALSTSIRFGLGGMFFLYVLQPIFEKITSNMPQSKLNLCANIILAVLFIDSILTIII